MTPSRNERREARIMGKLENELNIKPGPPIPPDVCRMELKPANKEQ
jgi:hypothetical protein